MATITFSNSDTIAQFVVKMNQVSDGIGEPLLIYGEDSNIVQSINTLRDRVRGFDDSNEIRTEILNTLSVSKVPNTLGDMTYNKVTGQITYTAPTGLTYDNVLKTSATMNVTNNTVVLNTSAISGDKLQNGSINSSKIKNATELSIVNSAGTKLVSYYLPSS